MNSKIESKLREGAFSKSIWDDHKDHIVDYPVLPSENEGKAAILKCIGGLARLKFYPIEKNTIFLNDRGILKLENASGNYFIDFLGDFSPELFHFQVLVADMGHENQLKEIGQEININPWLYGTPISLSRYSESNGKIGDEITPKLIGFSSLTEQLLVESTFFYLNLTLGLAVLKIGYENFVNSLEDLVPVCNDIWQKYLKMLEQFVLEELE